MPMQLLCATTDNVNLQVNLCEAMADQLTTMGKARVPDRFFKLLPDKMNQGG